MTSGMKISKSKHVAKRISPYRYKVSEEIALFLTERVVCTIMPELNNEKDDADSSDLWLVLSPENIWSFTVRPQIESLLPTDQNMHFQRLALGYMTIVRCTDQVIDLSNETELISYLNSKDYPMKRDIVFFSSELQYVIKGKPC